MKVKSLGMMVFTLLMTVLFTIGGTTLAIFTSSTENSGNVAHAGTIELSAKRDHGDYVPGPMFYPDSLDPSGNHPYDKPKVTPSGESHGGWAPGDTVKRTMILVNKGTLDAKVAGIKATSRAMYTQNLLGGGSRSVTGLTSGAAYDEFVQKANVKVVVPDFSLLLYDGPLSGLIGGGYAPVQNQLILQGTTPPFEPGPLNITFEVHLDESASNEVQGKSFIFDFGFYAEQVRNNDANQSHQITATVDAGEIKNVGYINVPASATELELDVSSLFDPVDWVLYPDLWITSPLGETFGFSKNYLSNYGYIENTDNQSSTKATYSGYATNPETMTFTNPVAGKWTVSIFGGNIPSTATVEANLPIQSQ